LLPAGAIAGWDFHPLESAAFARRTPTADLHKRAGSGARPFEGANISTSETGRLGQCTNSFASSQRWSRRRPSCNSFFGLFTATRRPWMDLENTAAIFAAAAKKAHSVATTAESIQSVDFGSGVELGSRRDRALRASRIEIKIDRITQKSGDISKKQLDFLLLLLSAALV